MVLFPLQEKSRLCRFADIEMVVSFCNICRINSILYANMEKR